MPRRGAQFRESSTHEQISDLRKQTNRLVNQSSARAAERLQGYETEDATLGARSDDEQNPGKN